MYFAAYYNLCFYHWKDFGLIGGDLVQIKKKEFLAVIRNFKQQWSSRQSFVRTLCLRIFVAFEFVSKCSLATLPLSLSSWWTTLRIDSAHTTTPWLYLCVSCPSVQKVWYQVALTFHCFVELCCKIKK